jgi:penicillin-binding protein 1A
VPDQPGTGWPGRGRSEKIVAWEWDSSAMKLTLRFFGFLFTVGTILFLVGVAGVAGLMWHFSKDLPDYSQLQDYEPPVMTRVHASDGSLVAEYATQRRLYIPIQAVPKMVINAFLAAEDKNFYEHGGLDFGGMARAAVFLVQNYGSNKRPQGASTITQQVAKNFLLTNELSMERKVKEAMLALKIERTYSKDKILELYLNEIYLGLGAYGIAAASLIYFDKSVHELTVQEAAYLAALPKAPTSLNPYRQRERATERRNYVLDRMIEVGYISQKEGEAAKKSPLDITARPTGAHIFAAEYFAEEVRREIYDRYGEKKLYEGGLSVRATLDPKLQVLARRVLIDGLVQFDENQGWRGPVQQIDLAGDWGVTLADVRSLADVAPWRLAVVLEIGDQTARIGFQPGREPGGAVSKERQVGIVPLDGVRWAKPTSGPTAGACRRKFHRCCSRATWSMSIRSWKKDGKAREGMFPPASGAGDFRRHPGDGPADRTHPGDGRRLLLRPEPVQPRHAGAASAGLVIQTHRLRHRARQRLYAVLGRARRAAGDRSGPGQETWRPENYEGKFYGPSTLRFGIEHSRNCDDGASGAGHRHAADRRLCQAFRRL